MKSPSLVPIIAFVGLPGAALAQGHADQDAGLQVTISGGIVSAPSFVGDSSIVQERGSQDQVRAGAFVTYTI